VLNAQQPSGVPPLPVFAQDFTSASVAQPVQAARPDPCSVPQQTSGVLSSPVIAQGSFTNATEDEDLFGSPVKSLALPSAPTPVHEGTSATGGLFPDLTLRCSIRRL